MTERTVPAPPPFPKLFSKTEVFTYLIKNLHEFGQQLEMVNTIKKVMTENPTVEAGFNLSMGEKQIFASIVDYDIQSKAIKDAMTELQAMVDENRLIEARMKAQVS